ncbi:hypothetical protein KV102_13745 [Mumia sp. zg.B53]|uniref:hypothetical protein n=1 Tax=unclassified Mumia TaxID=2621872 RepID=UPI001C6EC0AE|nr:MULTISPECIES: hypothetical protein [unclassified Mumia]MBW9206385.1 hypothetical protein [Mumia sp. zg.B17]MBW9211325.1 hypothetical protein [Mumia sp. zg.B21]MBW9215900.1 hypothetical protein [Mumia sp. zg.B53]MDD9348050.1 hypothetical protein [Mumia sp.]
MSNEPTAAGTALVYAVSSASTSIQTAMAEVSVRLQDTVAAEGGGEIVAVSHDVTVVGSGDDDSSMRVAFTGKSRPREYVVSAIATIRS